MKDGQTIGQWLNWDFKTNGNLYITDTKGNDVYFEISDGRWCKREHDSQGIQIYFEDSLGVIIDNRTPEVKVIEYNGRKYQLIP
jgi:hypothetical protein